MRSASSSCEKPASCRKVLIATPTPGNFFLVVFILGLLPGSGYKYLNHLGYINVVDYTARLFFSRIPWPQLWRALKSFRLTLPGGFAVFFVPQESSHEIQNGPRLLPAWALPVAPAAA